MNSYNKPRSMLNKGMRKQAIPAPKLMAIENEFHHTKDALVWEIKRLRGEVGVLAKRYNHAKGEIEDLVRRVRSQPPPPIPRRDEETEKRNKERRKRWTEHLQREEEEEKRKRKESEREENKVTMQETTMQDSQPSTEQEKEDNILSPNQSPLDQSPQLHNNESEDTPMPDTPDKTPLENGSNDVEVATEETIKRVEIVVGEKWLRKMKRKNMKAKENELATRCNKWLFRTNGIEKKPKMDLRWLKEKAEKVLEKAEKKYKLELVDAYIAAWMMRKEGKKWKMEYEKDRVIFTEED